jgi:hypothetical protein
MCPTRAPYLIDYCLSKASTGNLQVLAELISDTERVAT